MKGRGRRWIAALTLAVGLIALQPAAAEAVPPQAVISGFFQALEEVMRPNNGNGFEHRFAHLKPAMTAAFNLGQMTRIAVGSTWNGLASEVQYQLVERFTDYSVANYARNFKKFSGGALAVYGTRTAADGRVIVETALTPPGEAPVAINYLLQESDGRWQVVDVFLSGTISELANRRSEFRSVIGRDGVDGLVRLLERKVSELRAD